MLTEAIWYVRGCSGISHVNWVIRGITSCHQVEDRGLFISGDPCPMVNTINLTEAQAEGTRVISTKVARCQQLFVSAVDALADTVTFEGAVLVGGATKELVFLRGMLFPTDTADNCILGMIAALCGMPKSLALGTLLD
jgi:hypothetical protein